MLRFTVKDTGIGIPEEKHTILFESFTQADSSTTRQFGGTGLGLAISKQLSELMGGKIGIRSCMGKGSEFWFTAVFGINKDTTKVKIEENALRGKRVLIVDDNDTNREILTIQFKTWGIVMGSVASGPEALGALYSALSQNEPYEIAVLDMMMPGMDGETLGRMIKSDARLRDLKLVMMTSLGNRGDSKLMKEIGFNAYLTKPVRQSELYYTLVSLVSSDAADTRKSKLITRHSLNDLKLNSTGF